MLASKDHWLIYQSLDCLATRTAAEMAGREVASMVTDDERTGEGYCSFREYML